MSFPKPPNYAALSPSASANVVHRQPYGNGNGLTSSNRIRVTSAAQIKPEEQKPTIVPQKSAPKELTAEEIWMKHFAVTALAGSKSSAEPELPSNDDDVRAAAVKPTPELPPEDDDIQILTVGFQLGLDEKTRSAAKSQQKPKYEHFGKSNGKSVESLTFTANDDESLGVATIEDVPIAELLAGQAGPLRLPSIYFEDLSRSFKPPRKVAVNLPPSPSAELMGVVDSTRSDSRRDDGGASAPSSFVNQQDGENRRRRPSRRQPERREQPERGSEQSYGKTMKKSDAVVARESCETDEHGHCYLVVRDIRLRLVRLLRYCMRPL